MTRRGRSRYEALDRGYVCCNDNWRTEIFHVDCRAGGAQQVFDDLCRGFERAGWELSERSFDFRFMRRRGISWQIQVVSNLEPTTGGHSTPPNPRYAEKSDDSSANGAQILRGRFGTPFRRDDSER